MVMIRPVMIIVATAILTPTIKMKKSGSPLGTKIGTRQPRKG